MVNTNFEIVNIWALWLLILIPAIIAYLAWQKNKRLPYFKISSTESFEKVKSFSASTRYVPVLLRIIAILLLIFAMSRPRSVEVSKEANENLGIDIAMAIDLSSSMLAADFKPSRLEALKDVAKNFVENRKNDRFALIAYASENVTLTPLTTDKRIIIEAIEQMEQGTLGSTTAIGMGLGSALNRLKNSDAKSKVIILLTDGVNNDGFLDPRTAAQAAKDLKIKVYTIGIGTNGMADYPYAKDNITGKLLYTKVPVEIDESLLKYIASTTGGRYFRATDKAKLEQIYSEIDKLEKSKVEEIKYYSYKEYYRQLVMLALILLAIEFLLRKSVYRGFIS